MERDIRINMFLFSRLEKFDLKKMLSLENQLEQFLNTNIYNKEYWERNIKYIVRNRKILKEYETKFYDGKDQANFRKAETTIDIKSISKIYLRWHDPGEIAFETSTIKYENLFNEANSATVNIETLQGRDASKRLNPSFYFDDEVTISDDLKILLNISNLIGTIQRYSELKN